MKRVTYLIAMIAVMVMACSAHAESRKADLPTEVIGRICKTMEQHPPPTPEANYALMDYAVCGPGGLRVYPTPAVASEFNRIKFGVQGGKRGREFVYLHGYTRTIVLPSFSTPGAPTFHPRFRFSWLEVDQVRRGITFSSRAHVKRKGDTSTISIELSNPLNKAIRNTEVVLNMQAMEYPRPITKTVPLLRPGEKKTVWFDVRGDIGTPKGWILIKNYGRVYIDVVEHF